jgi:hypothetical protein
MSTVLPRDGRSGVRREQVRDSASDHCRQDFQQQGQARRAGAAIRGTTGSNSPGRRASTVFPSRAEATIALEGHVRRNAAKR